MFKAGFVLTAALVSIAAESAAAHTIIPGVSGFQGGMLHPLMVPTHTMNVISLGLLIGQRSLGERHALIAILIAGLAGAIALVVLAFATDRAETILLCTAIASGVLLAARRPVPLLLIALLTAVAAMALQLDSVPSTISASETMLTLAGAALAAFAVVTLIAFLAARITWSWLAVAVRIAGSWIAAIALLTLALTMR